MIHLLIPYPILWIFFLKYFNLGFLVFMCLFRPNLILSWGEKQIQCISTKEFRVYLSFLPTKSCCCCSVAKSCLALCDPMDCSMPGFPVLHSLSKPCTEIHTVWYILVSPLNKRRNGRKETRMWFLPSIYWIRHCFFIYLFIFTCEPC